MKAAIDTFFTSEAYAVVGVSRSKHKFGNTIFRAMKDSNLTVYPVHPHLTTIEDARCYASIRDVPDGVHSVVIVVHPEDAFKVIAECTQRGIQNIWLQQGAESEEALAYAQENGLNVIHGRCILMFVEPVKSIHAVHRWMNKLVGTYPQ
jgi:predicted CoA-binding protein